MELPRIEIEPDGRLQFVWEFGYCIGERVPVDRPTLRRIRECGEELGVPPERIETLRLRRKIETYHKPRPSDPRRSDGIRCWVDIEEVAAALADPTNWLPKRKTPIRPMQINSSVRFAVFERDGYTCRYCGGRPPEVRLEVDHFQSRATGGTMDMDNLLTCCRTCNTGKSDRHVTRPKD